MSKLLIATNPEVRALLHRAFPALDNRMIVLTDDNYQVLDASKAEDYAAAISLGAERILENWQADRKDCGKFTFLTCAIAQAGHACTAGPDAGLAVGMFLYLKDGKDGHQICVALTKVPHQEVMNFLLFDPQTGDPVILTEAEKRSVQLIYM